MIKILIVEDAGRSMWTLQNFISYQGYSDVEATSCEVALDIIESASIDLILLNGALATREDCDFEKRLAAMHREDIPVIHMVDYQSSNESSTRIEIAKPFSMKALKLEIENAIEFRLYRRAIA
ncbi:MAG: response regulator [Verrucomicrobiota bacterium]